MMSLASNAPRSTSHATTSPGFVVVHRGARDGYQVSRALAEAGLLQALVTDLYWPSDRWWAQMLTRVLPTSFANQVLARTQQGLSSSLVTQRLFSGLYSFVLDKLPRVPFTWRRRATRWSDACLGSRAGEIARRNQAALLSYSYYAFDAFSSGGAGLLFQLHPHPISIRKILQRELEAHPECAASLCQEWELSLPSEDFARLVEETQLAKGFLAASSFTRKTLIENGAAPASIRVVPYGVDLQKFAPGVSRPNISGPLRLLFVGIINQRKGIKYLVEALQLLGSVDIELTVCGRVVDDLSVFKPIAPRVKIRPSVSSAELLHAYQNADLFVLPSVAEGFGQVLLEALACGLPVLSTKNTAAPDLIDEGIQGFVVEPGRPDLIASRIEWALTHRADLADMRQAARQRAEMFSWQRFRTNLVSSVLDLQNTDACTRSEALTINV